MLGVRKRQMVTRTPFIYMNSLALSSIEC
jgi:hypothetical protein